MRKTLSSLVLFAVACLLPASAADSIAYPADYREWIFLSSGLGMTYGAVTSESPGDHPAFDNVFVNRDAYQAFIKTGKWPNNTMFVLDVRASESKGSINHAGHFQAGDARVSAEVKKDGQWTFYKFDKVGAAGQAWPRTATCYACHAANGASDNTFVQFYPTLLPIAREKGTLKQ